MEKIIRETGQSESEPVFCVQDIPTEFVRTYAISDNPGKFPVHKIWHPLKGVQSTVASHLLTGFYFSGGVR